MTRSILQAFLFVLHLCLTLYLTIHHVFDSSISRALRLSSCKSQLSTREWERCWKKAGRRKIRAMGTIFSACHEKRGTSSQLVACIMNVNNMYQYVCIASDV